MKNPKIMLACLLAIAAAGVQAQASYPQSVDKQTTREEMSAQSETYPATNFPYSSLTNFTMMEATGIQGTEKTSYSSFIGVLGEKWETDKRGRRGTFIHNGQEISVGYPTQMNEPAHKNQTPQGLPASVRDSSGGQGTHLPYAIPVNKPIDFPKK